jgi:biotin operon repressor/anti-sigma regulatory factor (Ser/Thr protein kinase)
VGRREIEEIVNTLVLTKGSFASGDVAAQAGLSRQAVHRYLKALVGRGVLVSEGAGRGARYRSAGTDFHARLENGPALAEDRVWEEARALFPGLAEHPNAAAILQHAFTEMLNNAIDHSRSPAIDVSFTVDGAAGGGRFSVVDAGVGVFENVRAKLGLASVVEALQEISKGKTTTQPERHSGEGIFFTSKMARTFELEANGLVWIVDNARGDQTVAERETAPGTIVRFEVALETTTTLQDVFARYTHDFEFDTSRVVIKLFEHGVRFVSRSEAKRLLVGLERFRHVILDFAGVEMAGQGFADEVFRVWATAHPETHLRAENMTSAVTFMVERARRSAT